MEALRQIVRVLVDGPNELVFDYLVPAKLSCVMLGCRVRIPLRNRTATGTVLSSAEIELSSLPHKVREIISLIDPEPLVTPSLMELGKWLADYYACPLEHVMRALLPESVRQDRHQHKTLKMLGLAKQVPPEVISKIQRKAPRQAQILEALSASQSALSLRELGGSAVLASARALVKAGWLRIWEEAERRDPEATEEYVETQPLPLNEEQAVALKVIQSTMSSDQAPKPILLHGVTGSGKTEIYLQAVDYCIKLGRQAIVLVPEIALAPQTVARFKARFASVSDQVAVLHSNLSQGERFDEWHRIRKGEAKIVIGARSAIFAPLKDPGLLIVDEEHEGSYKQDTSPRYHGRDVAVLRAHLEQCTIVLGSATPSLESYQNALDNKYQLVKLTKRVDAQAMPIMRVIDMKIEARKHKGGPAILSERLRQSIQKRLDESEQVILFLNRRGFSRSLQCGVCGHVCECPHCAIPLTYHRTEERLICHICGHHAVTPKRCPSCSDPGIRYEGYGTQQVEAVLQKVFPGARISRLDADTARKKNALKDTLKAFKTRKIDILLGTQMIAKGLHFPNVTLVGVLNADLGLHVPDFRAGERTFSLLTQVAGRAGRGELEGEVVIQTYTPHSPSIQYARHHDYCGYAEQELAFRQEFNYPPFSHMAVITSRCPHEARAEFSLKSLHHRLNDHLPKTIELTEPLPSPLVRAHGQYRFQLTLRSKSARSIARHINETVAKFTLPEDVTLTIDIDAHSFS